MHPGVVGELGMERSHRTWSGPGENRDALVGGQDLDIRPGLYDAWLDCLIQSVREYDPDFTDEIEELWRDVMRFGIKYLTDRY